MTIQPALGAGGIVRSNGWRDYQRELRRRQGGRRRVPAAALLSLLVLGAGGFGSLTGGAYRSASGGAEVATAQATAATARDAAATARDAAARPEPRPAPDRPESAVFPLDAAAVARAETADGAARVHLADGRTARLTIDPLLQRRVEAILARARPVAGAIVLLDPRDGRVLALASTSRDRSLGDLPLRSEFPAASLFKLVTAAAGLEAGTVTPATTIRTMGGGLRRLRPEHVVDDPRRERWAMTIEQAFATSNNPVFGKLAVKRVGAGRLAEAARAFAFNREIPFDLPLAPSHAAIPDDPLGLGKTGAGFGEVTISPVHAALVAAAIANEGRMPRPWIVESVTDAEGRVVFEGGPALLSASVTPETARALGSMMVDTVTRGTSRRAFRGSRAARRGEIAGKTGSLAGRNPAGHYDWFAGFAPTEAPEVAVAALLVNGNLWHLKGSGAAREALEAWFDTRR